MLENVASSVKEVDSTCCFDAAAALERLDGDEELFTALIDIFQQDSVDLAERLSASLATGNIREVERAAHSLKGLAANFDAKGATEAAARIEEMARNRTITGIEPLVHRLELRLEELRAALRRWEA